MKPRGAPTSVFLAEVARREREAVEAAKVDPWQSDGDEEEDASAALEEEEDPLHGERVHAWVSFARGVLHACAELCRALFVCAGDGGRMKNSEWHFVIASPNRLRRRISIFVGFRCVTRTASPSVILRSPHSSRSASPGGNGGNAAARVD